MSTEIDLDPVVLGRSITTPRGYSDEGYWRAMSQENVEVVRRAIDALNRRDLDAAFRYLDPEIEVDWSQFRRLEAGVNRGEPAARGFWITPLEFIEAGDHVVVPNSTLVCGRDGIEAVARSAPVVTIRSGRIVVCALYQEKAEALEAVGRRE